jgi:hypothetical protein
MREILFSLIVFLQFTFSAFALSGKTMTDPREDKMFISLPGTTISISLAGFIRLDAKSFKRLIGEKLSFIKKISFKVNQIRFRKCMRKDGTVNISKFEKTSEEVLKFSIVGFMLGFIGWVPGLIAALLIDHKKKPKNIFLSALIGCVVSPWSFIVYLGILFAPR